MFQMQQDLLNKLIESTRARCFQHGKREFVNHIVTITKVRKGDRKVAQQCR